MFCRAPASCGSEMIEWAREPEIMRSDSSSTLAREPRGGLRLGRPAPCFPAMRGLRSPRLARKLSGQESVCADTFRS